MVSNGAKLIALGSGLLSVFIGTLLCYEIFYKRKKKSDASVSRSGTVTAKEEVANAPTLAATPAVLELEELPPPRDKDILVLGLKNAGKTALLEEISGQRHVTSKPTQGVNIVSLMGTNDNRHNFVELGGDPKTKQYWSHFYEDKCLLVFVVDASREAAFPESKKILHEVLSEPKLTGISLVLIAHKQDLNGAVGAEKVYEAMELNKFISHGRKIYPVQSQSPPKDTAIGIRELRNLLKVLAGAAKD